jgi:hypothetical protein
LLHRTSSFYPWLSYLLPVLAIVVAVGVLLPRSALSRPALIALGIVGVLTLGGGSAAYALDTAATAHTGSTPTAGPATSTGSGFGGGSGGGFGGGGTRGGFPGGGMPGGTSGSAPPGGATGAERPSGTSAPAGGTSGGTSAPSASGTGASTDSALVTLLKNTSTTWAAAAIGSQSAGPLELSSGKAVMAIGGFSGTDAAPTLAQFEAYVRAGKIHYFISSGTGGGFGAGRSGGSSAITQWVAAHYTAKTVGGSTVYDLTQAKS